MTPRPASVASVFAAIDAERPGLSAVKKTLLLFFAQGHHLANHGQALFVEPMYVTRHGIAVDSPFSGPAVPPDDAGQLDSIGYVVERYAGLSPADLRTLVHASGPWRAGRIDSDGLREWFLREDETNDPDDERLNRAECADSAEVWRKRMAVLQAV